MTTSSAQIPKLLFSVLQFVVGSVWFAQFQCAGVTKWIHVFGINVGGMPDMFHLPVQSSSSLAYLRFGLLFPCSASALIIIPQWLQSPSLQ